MRKYHDMYTQNWIGNKQVYRLAIQKKGEQLEEGGGLLEFDNLQLQHQYLFTLINFVLLWRGLVVQ